MSMFSKLNQIKELRNQAKAMQKTLSQEQEEVSYKGVTLRMDGNQNLIACDINPELLSRDKKKQLEENIIKAHEELIKKIHRIMAKKIKDSGYSLPNLK